MKQAIAGVTPSQLDEVTVMIVWPSIARYPSGRFLGRLYSIDVGFYIFTVGNFLALASIPHAIALYFYRLLPSLVGAPWHGSRYQLTNRRVLELRSEVNFGPGSRWMRIAAGVSLLVFSLIVWLLAQQLALGWQFPGSLLGWLVTLLCLAGVLGGLAPLVAEVAGSPVPMPCFTFAAEVKSIELDRFDTIEIERRPGQHWFDAGDLVFKLGNVETFRLEGVSRPESFRHTCLKSHQSFVGVKQALGREAVPA